MQPFNAMKKFKNYLKRGWYTYWGTRAFKKNQWDRAERLLLLSIKYDFNAAQTLIMLGSIDFLRGNFEKAALLFRSIPASRRSKETCQGYSCELFRLLACHLEQWDCNSRYIALDWPLTSNWLPSALVACHKRQDLGDFTTIEEFQRFQGRPPISADEIQIVDTEKLLKALLRNKR